jgi:hypothetical protein
MISLELKLVLSVIASTVVLVIFAGVPRNPRELSRFVLSWLSWSMLIAVSLSVVLIIIDHERSHDSDLHGDVVGIFLYVITAVTLLVALVMSGFRLVVLGVRCLPKERLRIDWKGGRGDVRLPDAFHTKGEDFRADVLSDWIEILQWEYLEAAGEYYDVAEHDGRAALTRYIERNPHGDPKPEGGEVIPFPEGA